MHIGPDLYGLFLTSDKEIRKELKALPREKQREISRACDSCWNEFKTKEAADKFLASRTPEQRRYYDHVAKYSNVYF